MKKYIILIISIFLLVGCGLSTPIIDNIAQNSTEAIENKENFNSDNTFIIRELSTNELFRLHTSLASDYFYKNLRLQDNIDLINMPIESINGDIISWKYPESEMTDVQLLYILDKTYKDIPKERYMPKDGEINYENLESLINEYLDYYNLSETNLTNYYGTYQDSSNELGYALWNIKIHIDENDADYVMYLNASNGDFVEYRRYNKDTFTENYIKPTAEDKLDQFYSEEEIVNIVTKYIKSIFSENERIINTQVQTVDINKYLVTVNISNGESYTVNILNNIGLIESLKKN